MIICRGTLLMRRADDGHQGKSLETATMVNPVKRKAKLLRPPDATKKQSALTPEIPDLDAMRQRLQEARAAIGRIGQMRDSAGSTSTRENSTAIWRPIPTLCLICWMKQKDSSATKPLSNFRGNMATRSSRSSNP